MKRFFRRFTLVLSSSNSSSSVPLVTKIKNEISSRSPHELKPILSALIIDKRLDAAEKLYESLLESISTKKSSFSPVNLYQTFPLPPLSSDHQNNNLINNDYNDIFINHTITDDDNWNRYTIFQFIEAYLDCDKKDQAERWLSKPITNKDPFAYALFFKFYLKKKDLISINNLMQKIKNLNIPPETIFNHLSIDERNNFTRLTLESTCINPDIPLTVNQNQNHEKASTTALPSLSSTTLTENINRMGSKVSISSLLDSIESDSPPSIHPLPSDSPPSLIVKCISSKNQGISFIKQSLRQLEEQKKKNFNLNSNLLDDKNDKNQQNIKNDKLEFDSWHLQELLEQDCMSSSIAQYQRYQSSLAERTGLGSINSIMKQLERWMRQLSSLIDDFISKELNENENEKKFICSPPSPPSSDPSLANILTNNFSLYAAMLKTLAPEKISLIVLQEMNKIGNIVPDLQGTPVVKLASLIGDSLDREIFALQVSKKEFLQDLYIPKDELSRLLHDRKSFDRLRLRAIQKYEMNLQERRDNWIPRWSNNLKVEIGSFLIEMAIKNLELSDEKEQEDQKENRDQSEIEIESKFNGNGNQNESKFNGNLKFKIKEKENEKEKEFAYFHQYAKYEGNKRYGIIKMNPKLFDRLVRDKSILLVEPTAMPMITPPRPWISYNSGGYLLHRNYFVRLKEDDYHLAEIHKANSLDSLEPILAGLDHLGQIPWKINEFILEIAIKMWNNGINVATMTLPPPPREFSYRARGEFRSQEDYLKYVREVMDHRTLVSNSHSLMCDVNYKLEIANQFMGIPFYLPHSVDFRGRAYPIPPYLNHLGSDLSRGLLSFHEGKPLGERGIRWLKIHLANKYGMDKCSFEERIKFVDQNMENIIDSMERPLEGGGGGERDQEGKINKKSIKWWRQAEDPWQCLATCHELINALRSPLPEAYISHLPVQQDGSCNGPQHYAALGRDIEGGASVNLVPSSEPQDIYSKVAKKVAEQVEMDANAFNSPSSLNSISNFNGNGNLNGKLEIGKLANMLKGKITRKIVKQPVMTSVYGVSLFGARLQIAEVLKEYEIVEKEHVNSCALYLSKLTFASLDSMFTSAKLIQKWLHNSAKEISCSLSVDAAKRFGYSHSMEEVKSKGRNEGRNENNNKNEIEFGESYPQTEISWTTPLGFKIVQPYKKSNVIKLQTVLQVISLKQTNNDDPVDHLKQTKAFPPNFVHSLDASHMFMTANKCHQNGITFASVHDSFWTHASTVDRMNRIIREEFVSLHQRPILEDLRCEFIKNYGAFKVPLDTTSLAGKRNVKWRNVKIEKLPELGKLDLDQVLKSEYFFN